MESITVASRARFIVDKAAKYNQWINTRGNTSAVQNVSFVKAGVTRLDRVSSGLE